MKNTKIILGIVVLVIFIGGGVYFINKTPQVNTTYPKTTDTNIVKTDPTKTTAGTNQKEKTYSLADISTHNNKTSCYTAVNGNVYDVTSWISQHPGGASAILSLCGKDGSDLFNNQHGGQRRPEAELANFLIGKLQ